MHNLKGPLHNIILCKLGQLFPYFSLVALKMSDRWSKHEGCNLNKSTGSPVDLQSGSLKVTLSAFYVTSHIWNSFRIKDPLWLLPDIFRHACHRVDSYTPLRIKTAFTHSLTSVSSLSFTWHSDMPDAIAMIRCKDRFEWNQAFPYRYTSAIGCQVDTLDLRGE